MKTRIVTLSFNTCHVFDEQQDVMNNYMRRFEKFSLQLLSLWNIILYKIIFNYKKKLVDVIVAIKQTNKNKDYVSIRT